MMKRFFSIAALVLAILTLGVSAEAQSNPPLRITEVDGSPSKTNATRLNFPNGTLSISGGVVTYTPAGGSGLGDVVGPGSATDNAIVRFDSTTGKLVQNSVVTIADTSGNMAGVGTLNTHTIPGGTDTFALLAATQSFSNKIFVAPVLGTPASGNLINTTGYVFANLASTPTTLAGYGITDAVPSSRTVNGKALSGNITLGLASADFANQGTTTTLLHGNAAGNPSFGAASLTADVSGILPTANGGTGIAFFTAAGPTVARVYTFPDAATTILTTNAAVTVAQGGTGLATLTANNVMLGNGTSTPLFVAPGTSGNVLTSNGTTWTSAAPAGGSAAGSDTQVQFNDGGTAFGGDAGLVYNKTTNVLSIIGGGLVFSGNQSQAAWTTNGIRIQGVAATLTDTTSSGTVAAAYTNNLGGNTIAASSATTFSDYYTTFMTDPTAGANVTLTRKWALGLSGNLSVSGTIVQTSASATAFESGPNGSTNPVLRLVNSTASQATGLSITGAATGTQVSLTALDSGSNTSIAIVPKGTGQLFLNAAGTAGIVVDAGPEVRISDGSTATRNLFMRTGSFMNGTNRILYADTADANDKGFRMASVAAVAWTGSATDAATTIVGKLRSTGTAGYAFGLADAASPVAQTLSVQNVLTGTSNTAGANFTIAGSQGTGTGAGGSILFKTAPAGTTGTSVNALVTALTIDSNALMTVPTTVTAGGTTGNQTINKPSGTVNIAAAGTSVTVTNSLVGANSLVLAVIRTNDSTATIKNVVPASGSFTITLTAGATAEVSIGWWVLNQ